MKAKDYARQFNEAEDKMKALYQIADDFFAEINTLIEVRHAQTNAAALSIFDEQDRKWRALARLTNGEIKEDGFCILLQEFFPGPFVMWKMRRK